jgi:hypothetical protein
MNASRVSPVEAARTSDLDIVVVFDTLPNAYREAFTFGGWPVETFVHDPTTLRDFFEADRRRSAPVIALVEELLAPFGGALFDGFRLEAAQK